jgi:hypothetical protein
MTANYYNSPTGSNELYGYKGQLTTKWAVFPPPRSSWPLSPGEGVFSSIQSGPFSPVSNTGSIRYRGLGGSKPSPNVDDYPSYNGDYLLTFNANTNTNGADETGYLAGMAGTGTGPALSASPAGPSVRAAGSVSTDGTAYPVGFGDKAAGLDKPGKAAPRTKPGAR